MNTQSFTQELPQNLELNDWLKFSLTSNSEIDRQIALEEMVASGVNQDFLPILANISEKDPSQSCRLQAKWLININEAKTSLKSTIKKLDVTPDYIFLLEQKEDFSKINLISQMLRKAPSPETIKLWRDTLNKTKDIYLIRVGLDFLGKFGEQSDSVYAINNLQNNDYQIVCSALSLLFQQDKELFRKYIKVGLGSKKASIILHSVHLLKSIDENEAIKYLSVLILNANPLVRQKALRELMLIKFEKVEALFWQYIGREDQPFLLVKEGLLATFNPAQHFPFKLYDIMVSAVGIKKHILQLILQQTIKTTNISGILKNKDINTYLNEIKSYIAKKKIEQTLRVNLLNLKATEVGIRADAVEKLSKYVSNNQIRTILKNHLKTENDQGIINYLVSVFEDDLDDELSNIIKEKLSSSVKETKTEDKKEESSEVAFILPNIDSICSDIDSKNELYDSKQQKDILEASEGLIKKEESVKEDKVKEKEKEKVEQKKEKVEQKKEKQKSTISFPEINEFLKLSTKEQKAIIKTIACIEDYSACKKTLLEAINWNVKKSVLLEIIILVGKFGNKEDAKTIYSLTKSDDYSIVAQAIKSVSAIDIDTILPELNMFLAHEDPRIKSAAFEVYVLADKPAAIQYVGTMLKNTSGSIRRLGLALIPQLDYPSAEPLLWWLLDHETNPVLKNQVGYMIAANPTPEGVYKIFEFTHDKTGEVKEGSEDIWNVAYLSANSLIGIAKEDLEKECWDRHLSEQTEESKEKSDYKFKSIVGDKDEIDAEMELSSIYGKNADDFEKIILHLREFKYYYLAIIILFVVFAFFMSDNDPNKIHRKNKKVVASEVNYIPNQGTDRKTQVGSDEWQDGIRSGARDIVRSSAYATLMQDASKEREKFREEADKKEKEYLEKLANDPTADKEDRDWAAAKLNENYSLGVRAYDSENYTDAEMYLERAVNDPNLNTYGKIDAIQKLIDISDMKGDKSSWLRWLDRLLKESKNVEGFEHVSAFNNFGKTFEQMEQVRDQLKTNPAAQAEVLQGFKDKYKYSDEEAQKALNEILNFKHPFDKNNFGE